MKIDPAFLPFAATLAAGVLAPDGMRHRRLVTFATNSAAYAVGLVAAKAPMFTVTVTDIGHLTKSQEKQLNAAFTGVIGGALTVPVVAGARRLPVNRAVVAVGLVAGFLVLDVKRAAVATELKAKSESAKAAAEAAAAEKAEVAKAAD